MTHEWRGPMPLLPACLYSIPHTHAHTSGTVLTAPLLRHVQALGRLSERWRTLLLLSLVLGHAVVGGALLMSAMEGWGFATSCYFCLVTMTTVGLGDMTPSSSPAKARKESPPPPQCAWACACSRNQLSSHLQLAVALYTVYGVAVMAHVIGGLRAVVLEITDQRWLRQLEDPLALLLRYGGGGKKD